MAMRVMARRFVAQVESSSLRSSMRQTRFRSDKNILSEEEKAAENIYIRSPPCVPCRYYRQLISSEASVFSLVFCALDPSDAAHAERKEQEQAEKHARKGLTDATPPPVSPVTPAKAETPAATQEGSYRNTAVVAGVIAAAAAYWLLSGSSKKEEKEH
ncbi:hypothetical protein AXG93_949s1020 [Marchantia polymorpha subsp. ruderalis]|uniref:Uncharacterized protein n=1 Tax=Marchantia polymorpha subsp. ruderalis TaxID=1480154 RepID=A0A176W0B5_MARPO|nr:hypothetical protein AXG93_949s1020 [Marchantia polymorpha subsp. ruderalis]